MRAPSLLLLLAGCNISSVEAPPEPVRIRSFAASPAEVATAGDVSLTWELSGPVEQLVLAIGACAVELEPTATTFQDACDGSSSCPCGASAPGEVLYTLTALGPQDDDTADTATRQVTVHTP